MNSAFDSHSPVCWQQADMDDSRESMPRTRIRGRNDSAANLTLEDRPTFAVKQTWEQDERDRWDPEVPESAEGSLRRHDGNGYVGFLDVAQSRSGWPGGDERWGGSGGHGLGRSGGDVAVAAEHTDPTGGVAFDHQGFVISGAVVVGLAGLEQGMDDAQHLVGAGDDGAFVAAAGGQGAVVSFELATFASSGAMGALDQGVVEPLRVRAMRRFRGCPSCSSNRSRSMKRSFEPWLRRSASPSASNLCAT